MYFYYLLTEILFRSTLQNLIIESVYSYYKINTYCPPQYFNLYVFKKKRTLKSH